MRNHRIAAGVAAAALAVAVASGAATAQQVVVNLQNPSVITIYPSDANAIDNLQVNPTPDTTVNAQVLTGEVLVSIPSALDDTDLLINRTAVEALAGGNEGINAFFVGTSSTQPCQSEGPDACGDFNPNIAVLQIGSAQVNDPQQTDTETIVISALVDGFQIGTEFGDTNTVNSNPNFGIAAMNGSTVRVVNSSMLAQSSGNAVTNLIFGDVTGLEPGDDDPGGNSTNDPNGIVDVRADLAVASVQFNNAGTEISARIGDGDVDSDSAVVELAGGRLFENFIGIKAIGDVIPGDGEVVDGNGFYVLNSSAQAVAVGNDADNRIAVTMGASDDFETEVANNQLNQGTSVTASVENMLVGFVQFAPNNDAGTPGDMTDDFVNPTQMISGDVQVKDSLIRASAVGNRAVNIIGGTDVSSLGSP